MDEFALAVQFAVAVLLPVVVFLVWRPRSRVARGLTALLAVACGWAFNVATIVAHAAIRDVRGSVEAMENLAIALRMGWLCPLATVLVAWFFWQRIARRSEAN